MKGSNVAQELHEVERAQLQALVAKEKTDKLKAESALAASIVSENDAKNQPGPEIGDVQFLLLAFMAKHKLADQNYSDQLWACAADEHPATRGKTDMPPMNASILGFRWPCGIVYHGRMQADGKPYRDAGVRAVIAQWIMTIRKN